MKSRGIATRLGLLAMMLAVGVAWDDPDPRFAEAQALLQTGRHAQAIEQFDAILADRASDPIASLGKARALVATGHRDDAITALEALGEDSSHEVIAERASLAFELGRWDDAKALADQVLKADPLHRPSRWVVARLLEAEGKRVEAVEAWKWFIDDQNIRADDARQNPEALLLIGQAAEKYYRATARGEELAESLNDVLNELYEAAIAKDPRCWQAAWLQGRMFLAAYREGDAKKELNRALTINPSAAETIVTLGRADLQNYALADGRKKVEAALEVNPEYAPAYVLLADLNISDERFADALSAAEKAVSLAPASEDAAGRLAAAKRLLVDTEGQGKVEAGVLARNPRPVVYYSAVGERLADRRKYQPAEEAFQKAIQAEPDDAEARIGLGMLYMQIGREDEAKALFDAAFAADPFNVRADNMMKVIKHMATYESVDSEHYRVLVDPTQDKLIGKYISKYLESVHGELTNRFGFSPPEKTKIEIMKNHLWFSGRTTGLPFIPTVGACTGKVVALASPKTTQKPYNWARVLTHEVAHVITLQQTEFNIPHWYTEALAVESEGRVRPQEWNKLLMERVPARKLLNLETINLGFIRPSEPEERQLAYCQAQLYAQYMVKRFGGDAIFKLLDQYRQGKTTPIAVPDAFGVPVADFEAGYLTFLDEVLKTIRARVDDEKPVSFSTLLLEQRKMPEDATLNAKVAYEYFARRDYKAARPFADKALETNPGEPLAAYVQARLFQVIGDEEKALTALEPALDREHPNERVLDLLAELVMKAGRLEEAEELYELGRRDDPLQTKWIAGLARVHLRRGNNAAFLADLAQLAANDADDLDVRQALAEQSLAKNEFEAAKKWATECLYIQVYDAANHVFLGKALAGLGQHGEAVEEFEVALSLEPDAPAPIYVAMARALIELGRKADAKAAVEKALTADPENEEAKGMRIEGDGG
jgi:tetratricopeptide (TPR) repeat protein